jgi:hypothetical protein
MPVAEGAKVAIGDLREEAGRHFPPSSARQPSSCAMTSPKTPSERARLRHPVTGHVSRWRGVVCGSKPVLGDCLSCLRFASDNSPTDWPAAAEMAFATRPEADQKVIIKGSGSNLEKGPTHALQAWAGLASWPTLHAVRYDLVFRAALAHALGKRSGVPGGASRAASAKRPRGHSSKARRYSARAGRPASLDH